MTQTVDAIAEDMARIAKYFWAGEAEAATNFFAQATKPEDHVRWLRHQCYRELHGPGFLARQGSTIERFVAQMQQGLPAAEDRATRAAFERDMGAMVEEWNHFRLYADILEDITGKPVLMKDLLDAEYPEAQKLEKLRERLRSNPGDRLVTDVAFTYAEGGGAGIFWASAQIGGNDLYDRIAAASKSIYDDEVPHGEHGEHLADTYLTTEAEWTRAREILIELSKQRLRMRTEMYGMPIDEQRIAEISEGKIEPLPV